MPCQRRLCAGHAMLALGGLLISWWSHGLLRRVVTTRDDCGGQRRCGEHASQQPELLWQGTACTAVRGRFRLVGQRRLGRSRCVLPSQPDYIKAGLVHASFMRWPLLAWVHGAAAAGVPPAIQPSSPAPFLLVAVSGNLFFRTSESAVQRAAPGPPVRCCICSCCAASTTSAARWWPVVPRWQRALMILMAATILDRAIDLGQTARHRLGCWHSADRLHSVAAGAGVRSRLDRHASRLAARPLPAPVRLQAGGGVARSRSLSIDRGLHSAGNAAPCPTCRCLIQWT